MSAIALSACSAERDPLEVVGPARPGEIVVDAVLRVGEDLPLVFLRRTADPLQPYDGFNSVLRGAAVTVSVGDTVVVYADLRTPGQYVPQEAFVGDTLVPLPPAVRPETRYDLLVRTDQDERVTGSTITPPRFLIDRAVLFENDGRTERRELVPFGAGRDPYTAPENQLRHADGLLEALFVRGDNPGYQVAIFSLDEDSDFVIDVSFLDEEDLDQFDREGTSPVLTAEDGTIRLPWGAVYYEGRYLVRIFAVDRNWYDLIRSFPEFGGGGPGFGGNLGDNFERPLFRLEGGVGLFGSSSEDSVGFVVYPPDAEIPAP